MNEDIFHDEENLMGNQTEQMAECPQCGENAVKFKDEKRKFHYGSGDKAVELTAVYPVGSCNHCQVSFTDERAEVLRHEAVCAHLGIHSPKEIVALRKRSNLNRANFAEVTKIGEASLARWESGAGIPNAAMDQYLYLLSQDGSLNKLRARASRAEATANAPADASALIYRFPNLGSRLDSAEFDGRSFLLNARTG